jgi:hypothetical protein
MVTQNPILPERMTVMANDKLLDAICPSPEEWKAMEREEFQERVGKCLGYLLERDQTRITVSSVFAVIGGLIGGALASLGLKG